jgi:hypothetical protein
MINLDSEDQEVFTARTERSSGGSSELSVTVRYRRGVNSVDPRAGGALTRMCSAATTQLTRRAHPSRSFQCLVDEVGEPCTSERGLSAATDRHSLRRQGTFFPVDTSQDDARDDIRVRIGSPGRWTGPRTTMPSPVPCHQLVTPGRRQGSPLILEACERELTVGAPNGAAMVASD